MGREIQSALQDPKNFYPLVGIQKVGDYVKGKVLALGKTTKDNPFVSLELIDLEGTTSKSTGKGQYHEVEVGIGDTVQLVATVKDLKAKVPQLNVGDVVTITYESNLKVTRGTMKIFKVVVD